MSVNPFVHVFDALSVELIAKAAAKAAGSCLKEGAGGVYAPCVKSSGASATISATDGYSVGMSGGLSTRNGLAGNRAPLKPFGLDLFQAVGLEAWDEFAPLADGALCNIQQAGQGCRTSC